VTDSPLTGEERRIAGELADRLEPGCRVVVADGAGAPVGLLRPLTEAARAVGGVELVLGWYFGPRLDLPREAFPVVRTYLHGYGLARNDAVRYSPIRLGNLPALLAGPWRPDLLLLGLSGRHGGAAFGTEVSWLSAALEQAGAVVAEVNHRLPRAASPVPGLDEVPVLHEVDRTPLQLPAARRSDEGERIGSHVAALIPPGACVQVGPGVVGDAVLRALTAPVRIRSGIVGDAVLGLRDRGLLVDDPATAYVAGSPELYDWADGRVLAHPVEVSHDVARLSALPLVAVNTALEIDLTGQLNVETVAGRNVAGVGGLPDFALAAARSPEGLSVVALPRTRGGRSTLVERLSVPASCARSDIDVVVTELGSCDLRGLDDTERARALQSLW
jgi:acyl-CoA hydrolase